MFDVIMKLVISVAAGFYTLCCSHVIISLENGMNKNFNEFGVYITNVKKTTNLQIKLLYFCWSMHFKTALNWLQRETREDP